MGRGVLGMDLATVVKVVKVMMCGVCLCMCVKALWVVFWRKR